MPTVQAKQPESRDFSRCRFQGDLSLLCSRILLSKYEATGQVFTYECLFSDKKYKLNYKFMQFLYVWTQTYSRLNFILINTFVQQGHIQLIKKKTDIYNVTEDLYFK